MGAIRKWFDEQLSDPQLMALAALLVGSFLIVWMAGQMLAPAIAGGIIAYLLQGIVSFLTRRNVPRLLAVGAVFVLFITFIVLLIFGLIPLLSRQLTQLIQQLPAMIGRGQEALLALPQSYPELFSAAQVRDLIASIRGEIMAYGQQVVSLSLASVVGFVSVLIYLILVPFMVFFFLKDREQIIQWIKRFLPRKRRLALEVWHDVDIQIANYVRGKFFEIMLVWAVTYATFAIFGLQFAMLLSVAIGLSVLIPYIGAVVVTIPVALIAYFQWGLGPNFMYLLIAHLVIQGLDGNVVVPLLFSEVVNLHPVAIVVAILFFGGLWGFWGVFFAIPLATVVHAVLKAWSRNAERRARSGHPTHTRTAD